MKHLEETQLDVLLLYERFLAAAKPTRTDYSEEAIPERDPAYQLSDGTSYDTQTVAQIPAAERLALADCLEQLGMNRARAAVMASL
jgi:hypothetical protein